MTPKNDPSPLEDLLFAFEELPEGVGIPGHRKDGTLPPHLGKRMVRRNVCAPYRASIAEVRERFGAGPARSALVAGWLELRRELHAYGLVQGFQWLGGSFVESGEGPRDVDVVTFFVMPRAWKKDREVRARAIESRPDLFRPTEAKARYGCDAYFTPLVMHPSMFRQMTLWYALLGHDRETLGWKGFVEVDLAPFLEERPLQKS